MKKVERVKGNDRKRSEKHRHRDGCVVVGGSMEFAIRMKLQLWIKERTIEVQGKDRKWLVW